MQRIMILFICILPMVSTAQKFNGGIIAGGTLSQVDGDTWAGYYKVGFLAGAFVSLRLSPHSSFQMEMEYIQKGSRKNANLETGDLNSYLLRLHYLEIPILYQYTFARRFAVEIGPAADVLLGSYEEVNGMANPPTEPLRQVTLSGIAGLSAYIASHLKAGFRFNYSLISLRNSTAPYPAAYRKILFEYGQYNNVLSFSLSWDFKARDF